MQAQLIITVNYDNSQGPSMAAATAQLEYAARHLANNGLLSGDNPSLIVDEWSAKVVP